MHEEHAVDGNTALVYGSAASRATESGCLDLMTAGASPDERNAIYVTFERTPDDVWSAWLDRVGELPRRAGIVCVGETVRSATTAVNGPQMPTTDGPTLATAPADQPAELGRTISSFLDSSTRDTGDDALEADGEIVFCFDSVTALLDHLDSELAFRFLHVLVRQLEMVDATGHFHVDADAHDPETIALFESLFDDVVEFDAVGADADDVDMDADAVFELLSNRRRRYALDHLREVGRDELSVGALADAVAAREQDAGDGDGPTRQSVYVSLQQTHLPRLVEAGVVDHDPASKRVTRGRAFGAVRPYLEL